jgi:hypothetical protein
MLHCCSHHGDYLRRTPDSCSIKNFFNLLGAGSCEAALPLLSSFAMRRRVDPRAVTQWLQCRATQRFSRLLHCENASERNVFSFGSVQ